MMDHPDVVVLDVMMPGLDGWETCVAIKSNPNTADIPVILLTASEEQNLQQHAIAVGANALLSKPCPADRLVATILATLADAAPPSSEGES
jgi:CheY-like chemotaxis protein